MRLAAASLLVALAASGCLGGTSPMDFLILDYTLHNTSDEPLVAGPGDHCGGSHVSGNRMKVDGYEAERLDTHAAILVRPVLNGSWSTDGAEPIVVPLPAAIDANIYGDDSQRAAGRWAAIDGRYRSSEWNVTVDGGSVTLPHSWSVEGPGFRIDATLRAGPHVYEALRKYPCE